MNEALVRFMNNVGITTYVPVEKDYQKLAYYHRIVPIQGTPEAELESLVLKIYHFDHYYDYSTDSHIWRTGMDGDRFIKDAIHGLEDKELRTFLLDCFNPEGRTQLMGRFTWLVGYQITSQFADLVQAGRTPAEAGNLIAISKFLHSQVSELSMRRIAHCTVYAKNTSAVKKLVREAREAGKQPMADPVTLPDNLYRIWGQIGELLNERDVYQAMLPIAPLNVTYWGSLTRYSVSGVTLFM